MKIDWVKKLSSRKFWVATVGFVSALLIAFNVGENTISQIAAIISAFGTLVIYILSESAVDKAAAGASQTVTTTTTNTEKTYNTVLSKDLNAEQNKDKKTQTITDFAPYPEYTGMKQTPIGGG